MIITIAHTKGGVGKSTLAWQLAHSFENKRVTIIDLDFQQTLKFVNAMSGNTFEVTQPKNIRELLTSIDSINKDDICIIDVGGFDNDINRAAIEHSDKVLIPISDSTTEVLGFRTFEDILDDLETSAELNIVLNNIHPLTKNFDVIKKAVRNKNIKMLNTIVRNRKIYKTTMGSGNNVFGVANGTKAQKEIRGVRDELTK